jgi:serine/tyrosine/threonine adenylyltransferase
LKLSSENWSLSEMFNITNNFVNQLPADQLETNERRQVLGACFSKVSPTPCKNPILIAYSEEVADLLGLTKDEICSEDFLNYFSGNKDIENAIPYAMCYGGHQFGNWAGQLGDGRAINIADVKVNDQDFTLQLKGAGPTPYSRSADGLAVLRSSIREFLCSEAMFHLGVPTTRALSLISTGDDVWRDIMYDGHPAFEPGAVVARVAPNFIRFGNFEIFSSRGDTENMRKLVDYTILNYFPHLGTPNKECYLNFIQEIGRSTMDLIVHWQRVGFVHGVMNTDNMSILGLTIDYGPYGWLESFDPKWTPNTTDGQGKRYAYGNQPNIGLWNVLKLMNAFYPLVEDGEALQKIIDDLPKYFGANYQKMMANKLGFSTCNNDVLDLIKALLPLMQTTETDFSIFFRNLAQLEIKNHSEIPNCILESYYEDLNSEMNDLWLRWINEYCEIVTKENLLDKDRISLLKSTNPKYILRNYLAQLAIEKAYSNDYSEIIELQAMIKNPYNDDVKFDKYFQKRPEWARVKVGSSMLSCSS